MAARSTRFYIGQIVGGSYQALYTVPAGKRAVIKYWAVLPGAAAAGWCRLSGTNTDQWAQDQLQTTPGQMSVATERYMVMNAGQVLWARHSGTSSELASLHVSGVLLDA